MALHPNMFLLNQQHIRTVWVFGLSLHPNMFLLNQLPPVADKPAYLYFTSQYVSIKSLLQIPTYSTMTFFTSQYVSIKSCLLDTVPKVEISLHPNMFLLNHRSTRSTQS